ncbi:MAG TPA: malonyl-[acyl-carrier protein] O-methyltransferase BioC [Gammaproteobacteria bacterium]|nr:malonyl-[acyl-carrier protein] O-methyltransferase BioC [Gammaproteobacteria bacterium]
MTRADLTVLDRRAVRTAFSRAARTYDDNAVLQREIADRLLARLDFIRHDPQRVLDLGCGTGYLTAKLRHHYPRTELLAIDLARPMVLATRNRLEGAWPWSPGRWFRRASAAVADAAQLPFADHSVDLIASNLTLQWCDPDAVFRECRRILRPGGLFVFTSFGPDTLRELRAAWRAVDPEPHVHDFIDMHDLGDALVRNRFADPVMDVERLTLTYTDVRDLLRDLKGMGAHNAATRRHATLTGKNRFARFREAYEPYRQSDGRLPATYEVVFGHAWIPLQDREPGTVTVALDALRTGRR